MLFFHILLYEKYSKISLYDAFLSDYYTFFNIFIRRKFKSFLTLFFLQTRKTLLKMKNENYKAYLWIFYISFRQLSDYAMLRNIKQYYRRIWKKTVRVYIIFLLKYFKSQLIMIINILKNWTYYKISLILRIKNIF